MVGCREKARLQRLERSFLSYIVVDILVPALLLPLAYLIDDSRQTAWNRLTVTTGEEDLNVVAPCGCGSGVGWGRETAGGGQ